MSFIFEQSYVESGLDYKSYGEGIDATLAQSPVDEAAAKMRPYAENNRKVMLHFDNVVELSEALKEAIRRGPAITWVVITEGWCGDAAYNVPVIAEVAKQFPDKVKLKLFLRDSNLELIDAYLTNGGRSIPKLIALNAELKEVGTWGPRPAPLQLLMTGWKEAGLTLKDILPKVHEWYLEDNTNTVQRELLALVESYS